jgi:hypothetical protein
MNPTILILKPQLSIVVVASGLGVDVKAVKSDAPKRPRN